MSKSVGLTILSLFALVALSSITYANVVDRDRIENTSIEGVSLNDGAEVAFYKLIEAGFRTDVDTYEEWTESGRSFVKGDPSSPSSTPNGYTEIVLERNGHRLRKIQLSKITPRQRFNTVDEIEQVKAYFGIPADAPNCDSNDFSGFCGAEDGKGQSGYGIQLLSGNQRYEWAELLDIPPTGLVE